MLLTSVKDHREYLETTIRELRNKLRKLSTLVLTESIVSKDYENEYKKLYDQYIALITKEKDIHLFTKKYIQGQPGARSFYIPPSYANHQRAIIQTTTVTSKKSEKVNVIPKPVSLNRMSPTSALRDLIFRIFPFSNEEQCKTTKRSSKEYITKTDMVKLINENDVLKRRLPADFKKLSKDDLCKQVAIVGKF